MAASKPPGRHRRDPRTALGEQVAGLGRGVGGRALGRPADPAGVVVELEPLVETLPSLPARTFEDVGLLEQLAVVRLVGGAALGRLEQGLLLVGIELGHLHHLGVLSHLVGVLVLPFLLGRGLSHTLAGLEVLVERGLHEVLLGTDGVLRALGRTRLLGGELAHRATGRLTTQAHRLVLGDRLLLGGGLGLGRQPFHRRGQPGHELGETLVETTRSAVGRVLSGRLGTLGELGADVGQPRIWESRSAWVERRNALVSLTVVP